MYSSKEAAAAAAAAAADPNYPTQWALNPSAYQNVDSSNVDWAALAQQWIAMKEAAAILATPNTQSSAKGDAEEGEAPMEVENLDTVAEPVPPPGVEWNAATNSWGTAGGWNQWGWGWGADSKLGGDPSMSMAPMIDGFTVSSDGSASMPGYTSGQAPTFQHGYWTAPQADQQGRDGSRGSDRRSKSKNRDHKPVRGRTHREKPLPPVLEPVVAPAPAPALDAAKRRQLPAWIREGLEKMEREKQRAIEREQEKKAREEAEKEKKKLEEEELERMKAEAGGQPMVPAKSKFDSDSEGESDKEPSPPRAPSERGERGEPPAPLPPPAPAKKSKEEIMQDVMLAVRRSLTEVLLDVTDAEISAVSQEEWARYTAAQASRLNAMKASKSKALAAITSGLGLGAYESSSEESEDDEPDDVTDNQLQDIIKRKKQEFERTSREIEAEVRRAELREAGDDPPSPAPAPAARSPPAAQRHTPDMPRRRSRSSATPPPESETPEKITEHRSSKNHKSGDRLDEIKRLDSIPEEKSKRSSKKEHTPSPQKNNHNKKDSSSTSDSEVDSSSTSSGCSDEREDKRAGKRKRRSSDSSESQKKSKKEKHKKDKYRSEDKSSSKSKYYDDYDRDKSKSKRRDDYYDRRKSSRSRDYEKSHKDKYREDSDEDRPRKRAKRSRSRSYDSRSERRRVSRSRSASRRRQRERERGRGERDDKYDRYERCREHERRRERSASRTRHRR